MGWAHWNSRYRRHGLRGPRETLQFHQTPHLGVHETSSRPSRTSARARIIWRRMPISSRNSKSWSRTLKVYLRDLPPRTKVELWFQGEAHIGQKNGIVRQWARHGTRPCQPADQRYKECASIRRDLPRARNRCGVGDALRRHRGHATPYRLDQPPCRKGRPCRARHGPCRMAYHRQSQYAGKHHADLPATASTGPEPGRKHLTISAAELALQPRLR